VPIVIGANRDEGRTFSQGFIDATQQAYEEWVEAVFNVRAGEILARYPWPADADRFTAAHLVGAIQTDSGLLGDRWLAISDAAFVAEHQCDFWTS
jgi:para-nitrobenzyl esterase